MSLSDVDVNHSNLLSASVNVKSFSSDLWVEHFLIVTIFFSRMCLGTDDLKNVGNKCQHNSN